MVSKSKFEELVIPHMQAAFNLAYWILRSREDAEDVVQDAYVKAFRAFSDVRSESVKPWLLMIVRNTAYRAIQNRRRVSNVILFSDDLRAKEDVAETASPEPSAESSLIAAGEHQRLMSALGELSVDYREVIVLREIEGLSYSEIANTIDAPVGTVMSRLSRARGELRDLLRQGDAKDEPDAV
jgi:RNA polymerase sigma-70 factor, ECF subfamily